MSRLKDGSNRAPKEGYCSNCKSWVRVYESGRDKFLLASHTKTRSRYGLDRVPCNGTSPEKFKY